MGLRSGEFPGHGPNVNVEKLLSEDAFVSFSKSLATAVELTMFWKLFQFILHQAV